MTEKPRPPAGIAGDLRTIPGTEGRTLASREGKIYRRAGKQLRQRKPTRVGNFVGIYLRVDGRKVRRSVASLVLSAFGIPQPIGCVPLHFPDPDPTNNRLENLRWAPRGTNRLGSKIAPAVAAMVAKVKERDGHYAPNKVLDEPKVGRVFDLYEAGASASDIAAELGVCKSTVSQILAGRIWKHLHRSIPRHGQPRGSFNHLAKLDEIRAEEIRDLAGEGVEAAELARRYGVTVDTIRSVLRGDIWAHIEGYAGPVKIPKTYKRSSDEDVRRMREMVRDGVTLTEISRQTGEDLTYVSRIIRGMARKEAGGPIRIGKGKSARWVD
jgi:DNA invertase Pin-like site-specific DNA recombinase